MAIRNVLIIGGTGFIGSHIVAKLASCDCRVTVPTRRESHAQHLLALQSVEQVIEADVHDDATLDRLLHGQDAIINLVGILHGKSHNGASYGPDFERVHVALPRRIVAACERQHVRRFVHMSALGADPAAPSMYLRSKGDGEAAASSSPMVATTIFRPSVVFGDKDRFLNLFASLQRMLPVMMVAGANAKFQPVYVEDVALAFVNALFDERTYGKTYELVGPKVYSLAELVRLAGKYSGHSRPVIGLPGPLAKAQAFIMEHMPGEPMMTRDNLASMEVDNVGHGPIAAELGVIPTALEAVAPYYLRGLAPHGGLGTVHTRH